MKKILPILISLLVMGTLAFIVISKKNDITVLEKQTKVLVPNIGTFKQEQSCIKTPQFLKELNIPQPVMIDLSQKQFKGIALLYGKNMQKVLHPKRWEQYEHFSTYTLDKYGNLFLVPMPFISINPTTFNLQKNIYKLDSNTGKIEIFMHFDDVHPSANNPYGINAITYDCDDDTLWISAIDETDYKKQRGIIYHIDIKTKSIISKLEGLDALTLTLVKGENSKHLLVGAARDNGLYAYDLKSSKLKAIKLMELANANEHIRKIKIKAKNHLELQSIPFSYTLISQSTKNDRINYDLFWDSVTHKWILKQ